MNQDQMERRVFPVEMRVERREDGEPRIVGHAAVFNVLSEDLGGFREMVVPGAFAETILQDDVRALFNHDANIVLGRTHTGTLRLREDGHGLAFEVDPPATQAARDVVALIERGDVNGNSFGFRTIVDEWSREDGEERRKLLKVQLFDISPATFPAYPQTDVAIRSLEAWRAAQPPAGAPAREARKRRLALLD